MKKKNITKFLSTFLAIIMCCCMITGCSNAEIEEWESKYATLEEDYKQISENLADLEKDNDNLNNQIDELTKENSDLQAQIETLNDQIETLEAQNTAETFTSSGTSGFSSSSGKGTSGSGSIDNGSDNSIGTYVWISATGKRYHSKPNCGNMNPDKASKVLLSEAKSMGLTACGNCY